MEFGKGVRGVVGRIEQDVGYLRILISTLRWYTRNIIDARTDCRILNARSLHGPLDALCAPRLAELLPERLGVYAGRNTGYRDGPDRERVSRTSGLTRSDLLLLLDFFLLITRSDSRIIRGILVFFLHPYFNFRSTRKENEDAPYQPTRPSNSYPE